MREEGRARVIDSQRKTQNHNSLHLTPGHQPKDTRETLPQSTMVTFNLAYTAPINRPGASPVLTGEQVWAGLRRKVRRAQEFVPVITACDVVSEEGDTVVREATFASEAGSGGGSTGRTVREVCVHHPPARVDFEQPDGSRISNIVSAGSGGELLMTYVFEWRHPDVEGGSEEDKTLGAKYAKVRVSPCRCCHHPPNPTPAKALLTGEPGGGAGFRWPRWLSRGALMPSAVSSRRVRFRFRRGESCASIPDAQECRFLCSEP